MRLLVENDIRIPLINAFREAEMLYGGSSDVSADLLGFIADRMKVTLKDRGLRHDWITAVFESGDSMDDDLVRVTKRVEALRDFVGTDSGADLLAGYRRAANILRAEAKKAKGKLSVGSIDASLFEEPAERALHAALSGSKAGEYLAAEDFGATFNELAKLRAPIDDFFEGVMVNADVAAVRENRLALLSQFLGSVDSVVRLSALEG